MGLEERRRVDMKKSSSCPSFNRAAMARQVSIPIASLCLSGDIVPSADIRDNAEAAFWHLLAHEAGIMPQLYHAVSKQDMPVWAVVACAIALQLRTRPSRAVEHASTDVDMVCLFVQSAFQSQRSDEDKIAMCAIFAAVREARRQRDAFETNDKIRGHPATRQG
jgi:hypothetical protein